MKDDCIYVTENQQTKTLFVFFTPYNNFFYSEMKNLKQDLNLLTFRNYMFIREKDLEERDTFTLYLGEWTKNDDT